MTYDALELLKRFIAFPSLSHEEGEIASYVEALATEAGLNVRREDDNVWFWIGEGEKTLLLNSHLDVVPPSEGHPFNPFTPTEHQGRLYGRGSVDAKASGAAMTATLLQLAADGFSPTNGRVVVALTACEETGGGYNGMEAIRSLLPPIDAALVGEPTELQPCVAQKGLLILKATANGKSAHAARKHLGDNAIERAARDIGRVASIQFEREDPFLGSPTAVVTVIDGGTVHNVVPDSCSFTIDIRSTPAYSHGELVDLFRETLESDVHVHSERIVPVKTDVNHPIVRACLRNREDAEPFGSPTASDWIFLQDIPTVKIGPGDSRLSHTAQESIPVDEVGRAAKVYRDIITAYFDDDTVE
jgi:acetylornithine deacetylase